MSHSLLTTMAVPVPALPQQDGQAMLEAYLRRTFTSAIPRPPLSVRWTTAAGEVALHGEASVFVQQQATFLQQMPNISWSASYGRCALLFLDIDALKRPADDSKPGRLGPYVHSLWSDCEGTDTSSCRTVIKRYLGPGNTRISSPPNLRRDTNRYAFVLFKQPTSPLAIRGANPGAPKFRFGVSFNMARFARDNPGLELAAYNFMLIHGDPEHRLPNARSSKHGRQLKRAVTMVSQTA